MQMRENAAMISDDRGVGRDQMNKNEEYLEIDLLRLLAALWRRAWAIILAMVIFGAAAFGYASYFITPLYQSSALMYVNNSSFSLGSTSVSLSDLSASQSLVDTYIVILKTRLTLNEVIERAELKYSYNQLAGMISASAVNETEIFRIVVTAPDPEEATKIANTIAEVLPDKIADIMDGSSVRIVDYAVVPSRKSSPNITRYTTLGMLAGAVLSAAVIILMELFDEQIRDEEYLKNTYDLSMLAVIPELYTDSKGKGYGYGYGYGSGYGYGQRRHDSSKGRKKK